MSDSKADRIAKFVSVMKCRYKNFFSRIRLPVKKKKRRKNKRSNRFRFNEVKSSLPTKKVKKKRLISNENNEIKISLVV